MLGIDKPNIVHHITTDLITINAFFLNIPVDQSGAQNYLTQVKRPSDCACERDWDLFPLTRLMC